MTAHANGPAGGNGAAAENSVGTGLGTKSTVPVRLSPVDAAGVVDGVHVVVVRVNGEHYRRRVYLNLPSAQRAVERARHRGQGAEIVLCQLVPAGVVAGEVTR